MRRSARINGDYLEYSCGCKFKILEKEPELRIDFKLDVDSFSLECPLTWSLFAEGRTKGVFQLETRFGQQYSKKLKPENIEHLAGLMAILRPGCIEAVTDGKSVTDHYILRKNGEEEVTYIHPALEPILSETFGQLIFQEEALRIAKDIAGFNLQEADILRKCVAEGSYIYTDRGYIKIEKLVNNSDKYSILTVNTQHQQHPLIYLPIKDVWFSGVQECLQIKTECNKEICVTPNHQILTVNGWVEASQLSINDKVMVPNNTSVTFTKIQEIKKHSHHKTYDFEVDSDYIHHGFINGILVHNSIGKKKADVMAKVKTMFLEGCEKKGIVSKEIAKDLFSWIEKSQRYSFNKCLSPDTHVRLSNGSTTELSKLSIGDKIYAPNGIVEVTDIIDSGVNELYNIELEDGKTITCSLDHKFLCEDDIVRPLGQVIINELSLKTNTLPQKIIKITKVGKKSSIDITVDSNDHLFYANGIATSNSHAVSYAINAYMSAYAKAHFPLSFFTSYLTFAKDKSNKFEEVKLLVNDMKSCGINVLPPSFKLLNDKFKRSNKKIYFGLSNIKEVGESSLSKLKLSVYKAEEILNKGRADWTWLEFLVFFAYETRSSRAMTALIESGAVDYLNVPRQRMLFEYEQFGKLTAKERAWIKQHIKVDQYKSLIELLEELLRIHEKAVSLPPKDRPMGKPCANKKRVQAIHDIIDSLKHPPYALTDSPEWISRVEEARLGVALTASLLDECKNIHYANCTCRQFEQKKEPNSGIFIAAEIESVREHITSNGSDMAFINIKDEGGSLDCVCFAEAWNKIKSLGICVPTNTVIVSGQRTNKGSLMIKDMWQLL